MQRGGEEEERVEANKESQQRAINRSSVYLSSLDMILIINKIGGGCPLLPGTRNQNHNRYFHRHCST